jgi:hypothetical protein
VEQVTVTGARPAASRHRRVGRHQVRHRAGGNRHDGSLYYYLRHPAFSTNYYFNESNGLPEERIILNQGGAASGGPIKLPAMTAPARRSSSSTTRSSTSRRTPRGRALSQQRQVGIFRYNVTSGGVTTVRE